MLEFANEFGLLGLPSRPPDRDPPAEATTAGLTPVTAPPFTGEEADQIRQRASEMVQRALRLSWREEMPVARERVADWQEHVARVWQATEILDMLHAKSSSLGEYIYWKPDGTAYFDPCPPGARSLAPVRALRAGGLLFTDVGRVRFPIADPEVLGRLGARPEDVTNPKRYLIPAVLYLQNQVNRHMELFTQVLISEKAGSVPAEVPKNLLTFMWVLVEAEVTGKLKLKKCEECGNRFDPRHQDCRFCPGGKCGKANWRRRQRTEGES